MNRRAPLADRHALLSSSAYPSSSRSAAASSSLGAYRSDSPYGDTNGSSHGAPYAGQDDPYSEYGAGSEVGAPKKEGGYGYGANGGAGGLPRYNVGGDRTAQDLEEQNDDRLNGLSAKVRMLKDITTGIGKEVRDGTADMSTLQDAFSDASALLGNTFSKMNRMARRQGGWFCNMMLFILFVIWIFVILWWWRR